MRQGQGLYQGAGLGRVEWARDLKRGLPSSCIFGHTRETMLGLNSRFARGKMELLSCRSSAGNVCVDSQLLHVSAG